MFRTTTTIRRTTVRALLTAALLSSPAAALGQAQTIVTLTFDDGNSDQFLVRDVLKNHQMRATFYLISGSLGQPGYLTQGEALLLAADGNEIGGHTVSHADLPTVDDGEKLRQICNDRVALLGLGLPVTSFAYPFADSDAASRKAVALCGYNSGRGVGGLQSATACFGCPSAETIPPTDPYAILSTDSNKTWTTLTEMKNAVLQAEASGGGWVIFVNHRVCDACDPYSVTLSNFTALLDWLQPRAARGTVVKTMNEVLGGPVQPPVNGPPAPPRVAGANLLRNPSLESNSGGATVAPDCWTRGGFGSNTSTWGLVGPGHDGNAAQSVSISAFTDGARRLVSKQDLGACAPQSWPGHSYTLSGWYKASTPPRFVAYYRNPAGGWVWWAQSDLLPTAAAWTQRSWTIPPLPAGAGALSVGLSIYAVGSLTIDDFTLVDADATAPAVAMTSPGDAATVSGIVQLAASATDTGGVEHVEFLVSGAVVGAVSAPPWLMPWDSRSTEDAKVALAARAFDLAGNVATSPSVEVAVSNLPPSDVTPPVVELTAPLDGASLRVVVVVSATATDNTAVHHVEFLRNGQFFATAFAPPYEASFDSSLELEGPLVLVARAVDTSGNRSESRPVTTWIDRTPPSVTVTAPLSGATVSGTTALVADARDNASLTRVEFTVDGSLVATVTAPPWVAAWDTTRTTSSTVTLVATAWDVAGLQTSSAPVTVTVANAGPDLSPPVTTIACNGGTCAASWSTDPVQVTLLPVDVGTSGVLATRYTTDGTDPSLNGGILYTGPFTLTSRATIRFRSWDTALNAEAVVAQEVLVDTFAPVTTITCDGAPCRAWYRAPVQVSAAATDTGGAGLATTTYTVDGTVPTPRNGFAWSGPLTVTTTTALGFRSWDMAGNLEPARNRIIGIDTVAPTSSAACNGGECIGWSKRAVAVNLTSSDALSGVSEVRYTTDGTLPNAASALYVGPLAISATTTVTWVAWDVAGNASAPQAVTVLVDVEPPTDVVVASPANGAAVTGTVVFLGAARDNVGVYRMRFFLDGRQLGTRTKLPLQWMWDTTGVSKGAHALQVVADDAAGNQAASAPITVTVR
jgi:peptidoglycan/xylan/chitin deacetylase (PgdA/CDA1 family)